MNLSDTEQDWLTDLFAQFFEESKDFKFIVFDLETNGLVGSDVLSISGAKCQLGADRKITLLEQYSRYYYPEEEYNMGAIRVNGLSENVLKAKRSGKDWPEYFKDDLPAFWEFCEGIDCFVGHNIIGFDCTFFPPGSMKHVFDTAVVTTPLVKMPPTAKMQASGRNNYKTPRLTESAGFFEIDTEKGILHTSSFDVQVTTKLFSALNRQSFFRPISI